MPCPRTWKEMKKGTAASEPHVPSAIEHRPLEPSIIASAMIDDQPSTVRHSKRVRKAEGKVSKLRTCTTPAAQRCQRCPVQRRVHWDRSLVRAVLVVDRVEAGGGCRLRPIVRDEREELQPEHRVHEDDEREERADVEQRGEGEDHCDDEVA